MTAPTLDMIADAFCLTHWGQDKMAAILQMAFLSEFSLVKIVVLFNNFLHV